MTFFSNQSEYVKKRSFIKKKYFFHALPLFNLDWTIMLLSTILEKWLLNIRWKYELKDKYLSSISFCLAENEDYWVYYLLNRMLKTLIDGTEIKQVNINWKYQNKSWLLILGSMEHWISIVWGKWNEMMCNLKWMKCKQ